MDCYNLEGPFVVVALYATAGGMIVAADMAVAGVVADWAASSVAETAE